jgi:3alpha(or 20beta)-hydroxysteroid dehydrogenase
VEAAVEAQPIGGTALGKFSLRNVKEPEELFSAGRSRGGAGSLSSVRQDILVLFSTLRSTLYCRSAGVCSRLRMTGFHATIARLAVSRTRAPKGGDMGRLEGKVALVSGGARGQGEAIARLFSAEGARVVIGDILDDLGARVAWEIGAAARYRRLDVTRADDWAAAVVEASETFGKLDVLVNNAGILSRAPLERLRLDEYMRTIQVNQIGCLLGIQAAIPALKAAGGGSIVNTSSTAGLQGFPELGAYVSSKWAVRGLTKVAALELGAYRIRVNSIHPGAIATPMIDPTGALVTQKDHPYANVPLGRVGEPLDVARLALFLASDESSFCTGAEFIIDGGATTGARASIHLLPPSSS